MQDGRKGGLTPSPRVIRGGSSLAVAIAVLALLVGGLGCGGDDGGGPTDAGSGGPGPVETGPDPAALGGERGPAEQPEEATPEERRVEQSVSRFYVTLGAENSASPDSGEVGSFCRLMSKAARVQTIHYVEASAGVRREWDCPSAVGLLVQRSRRSGALDSAEDVTVVGVNVKGERATATVRFGSDGPLTSVPLIEEDGKWKLSVVPGGAHMDR
jgi:hypothetical protein